MERIIHARIFTMAEPFVIEDGYVEIENGKIRSVGAMPSPDDGVSETDARGGWLLPGLIDGHSHLGMWEDSLGFEGDDGNEDTDPSTPHLRAWDAINPQDRCFAEALEAGVTTVITGPGSANPISGQNCAVKTYGNRIDDMLILAPAAMKMALGENPKTVYHGKNQAPNTRMAIASIIRDQLTAAKRYAEQKEKAAVNEDDEAPDYDAKCEALLPVLSGKLPVHFHAHRIDDIFTAMRIAKEFSLKYVIVHGTGGHVAADTLAAEGVRVMCGPLLSDRSKPELRELTAANPAKLQRAGVSIALINDHPVIPQQYLGLCAGLAVREGLPYDEALKAITIRPAQFAGIDDRVGSVEAGKDADLVLFEGDPLTVSARPVWVMVDGVIRFERNA